MKPFVQSNLTSILKSKKILLGITGSIAAFKTVDLIRALKKCGAEVKVVVTDSAKKFVTPVTLGTLSGNPVLSDLWGEEVQGTHHIDSARWADIFVIAPASANTIGKLALGLADNLLSTELLAFDGPVIVAPAMNPVMYKHPAVQETVSKLKTRGVKVLGPVEGETSCGEVGEGRMVEAEVLLEGIAEIFYPANHKKILITVGPTISRLDPVRFLTNRSSGKMGASLAWAARKNGYSVTVVKGPCDIELPISVQSIEVETASEMADQVLRLWPNYDCFIGAAAILDWDFLESKNVKIKKTSGAPKVSLNENPDILKAVSSEKLNTQIVIGFAAETDSPMENARVKLATKNCDAIFVNDVSQFNSGFEGDTNQGWWIDSNSSEKMELAQKSEIAAKILEKIDLLYLDKTKRSQNTKTLSGKRGSLPVHV